MAKGSARTENTKADKQCKVSQILVQKKKRCSGGAMHIILTGTISREAMRNGQEAGRNMPWPSAMSERRAMPPIRRVMAASNTAPRPNVEQHNHWLTDGTLRSTFAQGTISSREKGQSYILTDAKKRAQARDLQRGSQRCLSLHCFSCTCQRNR